MSLGGFLLAEPVGELVALYGGGAVLHGLSLVNVVTLMFIGGGLGWLGAQLSVAIHLRRFS